MNKMGDLIEYGLLVGFSLFILFILASVVLGCLDWLASLIHDFLQLFGINLPPP